MRALVLAAILLAACGPLDDEEEAADAGYDKATLCPRPDGGKRAPGMLPWC